MFKKTFSSLSKLTNKENFSDKVIKAYYNRPETTYSVEQKISQLEAKNNEKNQRNKYEEKFIKENSLKHSETKRQPVILALGGGKGGIGKSFLTANLSVRLATLGYKVSAIDLDLGSANLHTCLGVQSPVRGISHFFQGEIESLGDAGTKTSVPNLTLYAGNQDFWQNVKPQGAQKIKLINYLQELDSDFVILDLGAGTHIHTLDFFIFSDAGILVVAPEPTSIENAYVFMKSVMFRKVQNICRAFDVDASLEQDLLNSIISPLSGGGTPFQEFATFIQTHQGMEKEMIDIIKATNIGIVMNQVRTQEDRDLGLSMSFICNQYFGFCSQFLGSMRYDDAVWKSIRIRKPLILDYPHSVASSNIYQITDELIKLYEPLRKEMEYSTTA